MGTKIRILCPVVSLNVIEKSYLIHICSPLKNALPNRQSIFCNLNRELFPIERIAAYKFPYKTGRRYFIVYIRFLNIIENLDHILDTLITGILRLYCCQ